MTQASRKFDGTEPILRTHTTSPLSKSVTFHVSVWPSEGLHVVFKVLEEKPVRKAGNVVGYEKVQEYDLRLSDFLNRDVAVPSVNFAEGEQLQ